MVENFYKNIGFGPKLLGKKADHHGYFALVQSEETRHTVGKVPQLFSCSRPEVFLESRYVFFHALQVIFSNGLRVRDRGRRTGSAATAERHQHYRKNGGPPKRCVHENLLLFPVAIR
jgi:hypothetical protein